MGGAWVATGGEQLLDAGAYAAGGERVAGFAPAAVAVVGTLVGERLPYWVAAVIAFLRLDDVVDSCGAGGAPPRWALRAAAGECSFAIFRQFGGAVPRGPVQLRTSCFLP